MGELLDIIAGLGEVTVFITPLTFVIGLINAIKKPKGESLPFTVMAVVSVYLIIVPMVINSI